MYINHVHKAGDSYIFTDTKRITFFICISKNLKFNRKMRFYVNPVNPPFSLIRQQRGLICVGLPRLYCTYKQTFYSGNVFKLKKK